ncbi:MAG: carboxypeptidase M32, partial [Actinobacteria bacterium]|nr:carboxypeptidase M32 [Actinomycetota bacterium]
MNAAYVELKERLGEIQDLQKTRSFLAWDQQVLMPAGGSGVRAEQIATLDRIAHSSFISAEIGRLLGRLEAYEAARPYDSDEASLIRVTRLDWEKARRVPADLRADMSRASSLALPVWAEARQNSDFSLFLPLLRQNLELRRRYVECFD